MEQDNQIKIIVGTFVAGYLTSSFNILSFTLGCGVTYCIMKWDKIITISEIPIYMKQLYEKTSLPKMSFNKVTDT